MFSRSIRAVAARSAWQHSQLFAVGIAFVCLIPLNAICQEKPTQAESPSTAEGATSDDKNAERYLLRFRFQPQQQLKYETKQTIIQTGVASFGEQVEKNKVEQRRVYTVTSVDGSDTAAASMQFEYVRMERTLRDEDPLVFDSDMKPDEVPAYFRSAAKGLKGNAPEYQLSARGIPVDKEGVEQTPEGGQASFMIPLPEDEKAIGDTWSTFVEVKVRMAAQVFRTVRLRKTFRLKAVEDGIATISMSTSVVGSVKDRSLRVQLMQATPSGTFWFDLDRGLITKKEIRFNNTVLNAMGPKTMVSAKGRTVERLL